MSYLISQCSWSPLSLTLGYTASLTPLLCLYCQLNPFVKFPLQKGMATIDNDYYIRVLSVTLRLRMVLTTKHVRKVLNIKQKPQITVIYLPLSLGHRLLLNIAKIKEKTSGVFIYLVSRAYFNTGEATEENIQILFTK